jgi:integrase
VKANTAADTGRRVPPSRRTIAEFFAEWLTAVRHSLKPSTYANYADVVRIIGKRRLQDIDVPTLDELYRHLLREGRCKPDTNVARYDYWRTRRLAAIELPPREIARQSGTSIHAARAAVQRYRRGRVPTATTPGLAPKTVKNVHRMLHRALSDAVAWGYLAANPATHASLPRERRRSARQRGKTWTAERLVEGCDAGPRRRDVGCKTASGRRTIALDPLTASYLRRHLAMLADERREFGAMYRHHGKLFCHPDGRPIHPDTITRRFDRLVDRTGVPLIRPHDVRHTYATLSFDAGVEPKVVADRIGHANMAYTLTIYTHRSTGHDQPAADKAASRGLPGGVTGPGCKARWLPIGLHHACERPPERSLRRPFPW